jgi:hypothetical protein
VNTLLRDLSELAAHYAPFAWFPVVWAASLAAVCAVGAARPTEPRQSGLYVIPPAHSLRATPATIAAGIALAVFVAAYVALVFYHDDLVGQDFNLITAARFPNVLIWPWAGRFVPLADQEYAVLGLISVSAALFHAWSMLQLGVLMVCVYRLMDSTPAWLRFLAMMFLLSQTSLVYSFFGIVFTERDLVFWLAIWLACMQSYARTGRRAEFAGAMVAVQFALYYKETAFAFIAGVAGTRLLLSGWRNADLLKLRQFARFVREHAMELGSLTLCAVFLLTYCIAIVPHVSESYAATGERPGSSIAALQTYVGSNLLVTALALAFAWRIVTLAREKQWPDILWEPLAAGGLVFALAYAVLGITREYYLAPVDVVAVLYLARLGYDTLRRPLAIVAALLFLALALQRSIADAAFFVLSRKEHVQGRVSLELALREHARAQNRSTVTLFLPQTGGFNALEFAAFLRLKGWRPEHEPARESPAPAFIMKSAHRYPDDICYPSQVYRCSFAPSPQTGDLVVLFPGRLVTEQEIAELRAGAKEVFHYQPQPTFVERALRALVSDERMADRPVDGFVFEY